MAALKPAEIASIELDTENRRARVIVPEDQLSLAIGKKGQNVRLASKLSGWNLDIVSEAEAAVLPTVEAVQVDYSEIPGIGPLVNQALTDAGILTLRDIFDAGEQGLTAIEGIGQAKAAEVLKYAGELYEQLASEAMSRARAGAREATPPTPRQILESMMPDAEGEAKAEPEAAPAGESGPEKAESPAKSDTAEEGPAGSAREKTSADDAPTDVPAEDESTQDEKTTA
jgi:N utilization substance protein A